MEHRSSAANDIKKGQQLNIDFHYGIVYVMGRLAGMKATEAQTVAHACQYIDDATTPGRMNFAGGEAFNRFATAHTMIDYHTLNRVDASEVWVPFHFFPGGVGDTLDARAICRPDSQPVREMVVEALRRKSHGNGLHRLGVALHTYVDTWAHQNFAGFPSHDNSVSDLQSNDAVPETLLAHVKAGFKHLETEVVDSLFNSTKVWQGGLLVGHGAALHYPDLPYAKWSYVNGHGKLVIRDNLIDFLAAAEHAYSVMKSWVDGSERFDHKLSQNQKDALKSLLESNRDANGEIRLEGVATAVKSGKIPGIQEDLPDYVAKGIGSWKFAATGVEAVDDGNDTTSLPTLTAAFETSDYRYFHDAVKEARLLIIEDILPRYNVRLV